MRSIPTIRQLFDDVMNDIQTEFGFAVSLFGKVMLRVLALVQVAKLKIYYLDLGNKQKNIFIDTADPEAAGGTLERWGRGKLGRNPFPATAGRYVVGITGVSGGVVPALTTAKSDDSSKSPGYLYQIVGSYVMSSGSGSITLRALTAGGVSELEVGDTLTFTKPLIGVNAGAVVTSISVAPVDAEDIELYRRKGLQAWRLEPQGGAGTDYRLWGLDAAGVAQLYPYAYSGHDNEIIVYVEATKADSTDDHGTPPPSMLADVEAVMEQDPDTSLPVDDRGRRPMGVFLVNVVAVDVKAVDITFTGSAGTIPVGAQSTITAALEEAIDATRPFIAAVDLLSEKNDILSVFNMVAATLNAVPGSIFTGLTLEVDGTPVSSYTFDNGEIPYLNSVVYP